MLLSLRNLTLLDGYFVSTRPGRTDGMNVGSIQYMDQATRRQFLLTIYENSTVLCRSNGFEHVMQTPGGKRICFVDGLLIRYPTRGIEYIFSYSNPHLARADGKATGAYGRWAMAIVDSYRFRGRT